MNPIPHMRGGGLVTMLSLRDIQDYELGRMIFSMVDAYTHMLNLPIKSF